jgi:hypothetical protein
MGLFDLFENDSDYKTGNSASLYDYEGRTSWNCAECGMSLSDNETWEAYGKIYCGTCYQSK